MQVNYFTINPSPICRKKMLYKVNLNKAHFKYIPRPLRPQTLCFHPYLKLEVSDLMF